MTDPTPAQRAGQIRLDLEALYRAGRRDFPDKAEEMSNAATEVGQLFDRAKAQAANLADVSSVTIDDLLSTHYLLFEALRRCVLTLNDCAEGCVAAAQLFESTDHQASDAYGSLSREVPGVVSNGPVPQAPEPQPRDDPSTT